MKSKIETKQDGKEFARFDEFLTKLVNVPKDEINKREQAEKKDKAERKAKQS